jgi:hypothetical protein
VRPLVVIPLKILVDLNREIRKSLKPVLGQLSTIMSNCGTRCFQKLACIVPLSGKDIYYSWILRTSEPISLVHCAKPVNDISHCAALEQEAEARTRWLNRFEADHSFAPDGNRQLDQDLFERSACGKARNRYL